MASSKIPHHGKADASSAAPESVQPLAQLAGRQSNWSPGWPSRRPRFWYSMHDSRYGTAPAGPNSYKPEERGKHMAIGIGHACSMVWAEISLVLQFGDPMWLNPAPPGMCQAVDRALLMQWWWRRKMPDLSSNFAFAAVPFAGQDWHDFRQWHRQEWHDILQPAATLKQTCRTRRHSG